MEKYIHEPTDNFKFENVILKTPYSCGGGSFFSKFSIYDEPFYIKTPKCTTKQGFIKSGKKIYCDLVFSIVDHEEFMRWIENLVIHSQKTLLEKSGSWFQEPMDENEIEDAIISPMKTYRAGKNFLIRCNVPTLNDGSPEIKVYDENALEKPLASIKEDMSIITLLEIRGIKSSLKSFQYEINVKQIMVVKKINILDNCLLSNKETSAATVAADAFTDMTAAPAAQIEEPNKTEEIIINETEENTINETEKNDINETEENTINEIEENTINEIEKNDINETEQEELQAIKENSDSENSSISTSNDFTSPAAPQNFEISNLEEKIPNTNELEEINLEDFEPEEYDKTTSEPPIVLKDANEIYYKMYFEAKKKAKEARKNAIASYFEAKNIKMLYDLDDVDDSEEDKDFMDFTDDDDDDDDMSDISNTAENV